MRKKAELKEKVCVNCNSTFLPSSGVQKYCPECIQIGNRERSVKFRAKEKERNADVRCCICGGKFGEKIKGKPYCFKHRSRYYTYGSFDLPERATTSTIEEKEGVLVIKTAKGQVILADADDYELLSHHSWGISSSGYAVTGYDKTRMYMHRLVMRDVLGEGKEVDHINGNTLDNRKDNLRVCSHKENLRNLGISKNNTSGYPGVARGYAGKYYVSIMVDYKRIDIGAFSTFEEAVEARKNAEDKYFGEYAGHHRRK